MTNSFWGLEMEHRQLRVVVWLNGVPLINSSVTERRERGVKLNPWIAEGANLLELSLGRPEDEADIPADALCRMVAYRAEYGPEGQVWPLGQYAFDRGELELAEVGLTEAYSHEFSVEADDAFGRWAWQDGQPYEPKERVAIEAVVMRLHRALRTRDADAVLAEMSLRFEEVGRSIGVEAGELEGDLRRDIGELFASDEWQMQPLDVAGLELWPSRDGRLVQVTGPGGAPALVGSAAPGKPFAMSVAAAHLDGAWVVVR